MSEKDWSDELLDYWKGEQSHDEIEEINRRFMGALDEIDRIGPEIPMEIKPTDPDHLYAPLYAVLLEAYNQAANGKGKERHGKNKPFVEQPMALIQDLVGPGFSLGQAMKKIQESQRMPTDRAERELLGAIVYIAGAILHRRKENSTSD